MTQEEYFAQNPNAQFGDYLNYAQGRTSASGSYLDPRNNPNIDTSTLGDSRQSGSNTGRWNWDEGSSRWQPDVYQQPQPMGGILGSGFDWHNDIAPALQFVGSALGGAASGNYGGLVGPAGQIAGDTSGGTHQNVAGIGGSMPTRPQYGFEPWLGGGTGGGNSGGLFDNLLGTVGNLSPALLAGYLGNSQRQDVMGQVGKINDVASGLNGPAFMQSITNPYDLQTGQGRTALSQSLQQRGVGGSSFGNQQLGNYDYQRGLGRGDLATRAGTAVAGTQGQLYSDALRGIVGGNAAYNNLLGAGLGASGSLFNRPGGSSTGLGGSLSGIGSSIANLFSGGIPTLPGSPPNFTGTGVDQYGNPIGGNFQGGTGGQDGTGFDNFTGQYGVPEATSGNGLFDWLGQNGGDLGLNF